MVTDISRSGNPILTLREDVISSSNIADNLLNCSKQKKAAHQIVL